MSTPNYSVNYDDERLTEVEADKEAALSEAEKTYGDMIEDSDSYYQSQIDASKQWAEEQSKLQQEKTDFAIDKIEQEKEHAKKDYLKEQSGAYVDWQKESNKYGANAEQMAANGLANTGFSESSQVSMYNTYQSRVTVARESYNQIVMNYNNSITEARLQNNSVLAEIAYEAQKQQLELSLQGFQYKNSLLEAKANRKMQIESEYHNRYQDVLKQINTENALAEEVRQYNEKMALEKAQLEEEKRQYNESLAWEKQKYNNAKASSGSGGSGGSAKVTKSSSNSASLNKNSNSGSVKKSSGSSVDMKSVINLGYGPISGDTLAGLVSSGKVSATTNKNGSITVKNNQNTFSSKKSIASNNKKPLFSKYRF